MNTLNNFDDDDEDLEDLHALELRNEDLPNFRDASYGGFNRLYLVFCYVCNQFNHAECVPSGTCAWCGWEDAQTSNLRSRSH
jgi:hypothetical protein